MPWFLVLHISALLIWVGGLLYLPALIAQAVFPGRAGGAPGLAVARWLFTHVLTPAALLAIVFGTAMFLYDRNVSPWLLAKLVLVVLLVLGHVAAGGLIRHYERSSGRDPRPWCGVLGGALTGLVVAIFWLVLAKPAMPELSV